MRPDLPPPELQPRSGVTSRRPSSARPLPWIPGALLLLLSLLGVGHLPPAVVIALVLFALLWLASRRSRPAIGRGILALNLFTLWAAILVIGAASRYGGPLGELFRHHRVVAFALLGSALALAGLAPGGRHGSPSSPTTPRPLPGWLLPALAVIIALAVVAFFAFLVRLGDALWVAVRPVGHDLLLAAVAAILAASPAETIRIRLGERTVSLAGLLVLGVVPLAVLFSAALRDRRTKESPAEPGPAVDLRRVLAECATLDDWRSLAQRLRQLPRDRPADPTLSLYTGIALSVLDRPDAEVSLLQAAGADPSAWERSDLVSPAFAEYAVRLLLGAAQNRAALEVCDRARAQFGESHEFACLRARAAVSLRTQGDPTVAVRGSIEMMPPSAEREYLLGILDEDAGKGSEAKARYQAACRISPAHARSWQALDRLARSFPELFSPAERAQVMRTLRGFGAPLRLAVDVDAFATITGLELAAEPLSARDDIVPASATPPSPGNGSEPPLSFLPGSMLTIGLHFHLRTRDPFTVEGLVLDGGPWLRKPLPPVSPAALAGDWGEVRTLSLATAVPEEVLPGDYELRLSLRRSAGSAPEVPPQPRSLLLTRLRVLPTLRKVAVQPWKLGPFLGKAPFRDVGYRAVVGAGWSVEIPVPPHAPLRGCLLVSGVSYGAEAKPGDRVGCLRLALEGGEMLTFPLRMGVETAETYAERSGRRGAMGKAQVWSSFPVSMGGETFEGHTYAAMFELPRPARVERLFVEVTSDRRWFLHVFHAVFVEADE